MYHCPSSFSLPFLCDMPHARKYCFEIAVSRTLRQRNWRHIRSFKETCVDYKKIQVGVELEAFQDEALFRTCWQFLQHSSWSICKRPINLRYFCVLFLAVFSYELLISIDCCAMDERIQKSYNFWAESTSGV